MGGGKEISISIEFPMILVVTENHDTHNIRGHEHIVRRHVLKVNNNQSAYKKTDHMTPRSSDWGELQVDPNVAGCHWRLAAGANPDPSRVEFTRELPLMQKVIPALRITNYVLSKAFYTDGLGFSIQWKHRFGPTLPVFCSITRDNMEIFLTEHTGDCEVGGLVHFYVPDVDACYAEFQSKGVLVHEPPSQTIPGLRDMTILDPDGNKLRFCTLLPDRSRT